MKVLFCGSGSFALPSFKAIMAGRHELLAAVTQPPKRAGRGGKVKVTPIAEAATAGGVEVYPCADINSPQAVEYLQSKKPDVICVIEFGQFIGSTARQTAKLDAINLHGSLLPALRGAGPVNWAVLNGLKQTGVCTFSLVDKMDAGAIYHSASLDILPDERAGELRVRLAALGVTVVTQTLDALADGPVKTQPQDESLVTFAPKLKKSDGYIDFSQSAKKIARRVRGTWPWPGGKAVFHRAEAKDLQVTIAQVREVEGDAIDPPGTLQSNLRVATGQGVLEIVEVKPAGKRLMSWGDFVNGYRIAPGDKFTSPSGIMI